MREWGNGHAARSISTPCGSAWMVRYLRQSQIIVNDEIAMIANYVDWSNQFAQEKRRKAGAIGVTFVGFCGRNRCCFWSGFSENPENDADYCSGFAWRALV